MLSDNLSLAALYSMPNQPLVKRDSSLAQRLFGTKICSVNLRNFALHSSSVHPLVPRPSAQMPPGNCQTRTLRTLSRIMSSLPILLPTMRSKNVDICTFLCSPMSSHRCWRICSCTRPFTPPPSRARTRSDAVGGTNLRMHPDPTLDSQTGHSFTIMRHPSVSVPSQALRHKVQRACLHGNVCVQGPIRQAEQ